MERQVPPGPLAFGEAVRTANLLSGAPVSIADSALQVCLREAPGLVRGQAWLRVVAVLKNQAVPGSAESLRRRIAEEFFRRQAAGRMRPGEQAIRAGPR
jgi:hypothetical protein